MAQPTHDDVQAVEPVLTNMLVAYMQGDTRFVASKVFPEVRVEKDSGTYYVFTKKYWFTDELAARAPGSDFGQLGYGVSTATYTTIQYAGAHPIPDEVRLNSQIPMDLETAGVRFLGQKSLLRKEVAFSADFMVNSVWANNDNNSTTDWDDFSAGDPVSDVMTARRTISNGTGMDANTMVMGYIVHQAIVNHPDILDRIAYVQIGNQPNIEANLAAIFGVDNYWIAKGSYTNTNEGQTFSASAIIDDDCLITYTTSSPGIFEASGGYTFAWGGGGGMGSIYRYRDGGKHADLLQHKEQWDQKVVATDLGYLYIDVV